MEETNFEKTLKLNPSKTSKTQGQSYVSWADGWADFKKINPDASFGVVKHEGKHYYSDIFGIMVETFVTVDKETHNMWLPVLDGANNAMKETSYTYKVKKYVGKYPNAKWDGKTYDEKIVQAVTMFDINTALMRCWVKNMGLFGYALHLYRKELNPSADVIGMQQVNEITSKLNEKGIDLQEFNRLYRMSKLTELHACNFNKALEWIENKEE